MTKRFRLLLSGALGVLALLACVAAADSARAEADAERQEAMTRYGGEVVQVVVATRNLEPGDEVSPYDCEMREWLVDLVPEGTLTSLEEHQGKRLTSPVVKGMPLTQVHLRTSDETVEVPSGRVAVTVPVQDKTGVSGTVATGTTLAVYRIQEGAVRLLARDVSVLASPSQGNGQGALTLAVEPSQVADVVAASTDGTLRLVQPAGDVAALPAEAVASGAAVTVDPVETGDPTGDQVPQEPVEESAMAVDEVPEDIES